MAPASQPDPLEWNPTSDSGGAAQPVTADPGVPESLLQSGLAELWNVIRAALDRKGPAWRGAVTVPDLDRPTGLSLESLIGRKPTRRLDLAELEEALVLRRIGRDLDDALSLLGWPPSESAVERREARARARKAHAALSGAVELWEQPWASRWAEEIQRSGTIGRLTSEEVTRLVADVERLLYHLAHTDTQDARSISRTELAAAVFGSAHALDRGQKLTSAVEAALRHHTGRPGVEGRELWEAAGIHIDSVSAPILTWALPVTGSSPLDRLIQEAASGAFPVHLSLMALKEHPVKVPVGTPVLVVENPRPVEAAAERNLRGGVLATNGNPTTALWVLVGQLLSSGAQLLYHGDFDASGIAICRRMHNAGCRPWMMDASDYTDAVETAARSSVRLETEPRDCGDTRWDPLLRRTFERHRLKVHEEFLLNPLLDGFNALLNTG